MSAPSTEPCNKTAAGPCPFCDSVSTHPVGRIPDDYTFAGRPLETPLPGGTLVRCGHCDLHWRHPQLDKQELDRLYKQGNPGAWGVRPDKRLDWKATSGILQRHPDIQSVLDVGCFDGRFLDQLGPSYQRAGIEVHPLAVERAQARGVDIIGQDFAALDPHPARFDAVVAFDVIEHVQNPGDLIRRMALATRPGGLVIVATGNTAAWSWRIMRGMYWYCTIAEHIAFINPHWCRQAASRLGLEITELHRFSHEPARGTEGMIQAVSNLAYRLLPGLVPKVRHLHARLTGRPWRPAFLTPPHWRSAKDHLLVVFRTPTRIVSDQTDPV